MKAFREYLEEFESLNEAGTTEKEIAAIERAQREYKDARKKGMDPEKVADFNAKELEKKFGMDRKEAYSSITNS